jgi:hypothetical protein
MQAQAATTVATAATEGRQQQQQLWEQQQLCIKCRISGNSIGAYSASDAQLLILLTGHILSAEVLM